MLKNVHRYGKFAPKHPNLEHQQECFDLSKDLPYFAILLEQGLGKSKIIIDNAAYLFLKQEIDGLFIVAPKSAYLNWMRAEIPAHMPTNIPFRIHFWDSDWTNRQRQEASKLLVPEDDLLDIFLMNIEAITLERAMWYAKRFIAMHYTMGVVDESTCIKNPKAKRSKKMWELSYSMDYRRILTGTPLTKSPLDIFSQGEFLKKGLLGFEHFQTFKNYFAVSRIIQLGNRSFEKIVKYTNLDELKDRIASWSYRKLKTECLDLPDKVYETRYILQTAEQKGYYDALKELALIEFSDESIVSSVSILTTLMKLHQINCGHVKDDFGTIVDIPHNRINSLIDIIEESGEDKIIIWCHFQHDVRGICQALSEKYGDMSVVHYYGETSNMERMVHLERFERDPSCRFFVSNSTGSKALTMVQASLAIYYSYDHNLETWLQSQDRNHRIGTTRTVTYVIMMIAKTIDERVMKCLMNKKELADSVLDDWRIILDDSKGDNLFDESWMPEK